MRAHQLQLLKAEVARRLGRAPQNDEEFGVVLRAIAEDHPSIVSDALAALRPAPPMFFSLTPGVRPGPTTGADPNTLKLSNGSLRKATSVPKDGENEEDEPEVDEDGEPLGPARRATRERTRRRREGK